MRPEHVDGATTRGCVVRTCFLWICIPLILLTTLATMEQPTTAVLKALTSPPGATTILAPSIVQRKLNRPALPTTKV